MFASEKEIIGIEILTTFFILINILKNEKYILYRFLHFFVF